MGEGVLLLRKATAARLETGETDPSGLILLGVIGELDFHYPSLAFALFMALKALRHA